ncbi:unnamed protein product, partial [Didymodactylos carnosus]
TKTNKAIVAESRCLAVANLPESATEENVKDYFKKYGRVHTVKLEISDEQRYAFVGFLDVRTASKAHNTENTLDGQKLRTAFHDGSMSVPKALLEPIELQITTSETSESTTNTNIGIGNNSVTVTNSTSTPTASYHASGHHHPSTLASTVTGKNQTHVEKRSSRIACSPDENTRHQVVPVKRDDSGSSGSKRKASTSVTKSSNVHPTVINSKSRNKHSSSNSSSSSSDSEFSDDRYLLV